MFMGKSAVRGKAFFGVTATFAVAVMLRAAPASAGDTVYYYSSDTVHSEVVVTDQNRNVVERTYYAPYGQVLNRDLRDGPGYTGHEEDPETGLVYMQQRYYCPECGRFLSVDPVGVDPTSGGNFNRYEYAQDNPYRYTDPDGRESGAGYATGEYNIQFTPQDYADMNSAAGDLLGAVGDFMNALPPDTGGPELHGMAVMAVGALREAAAGAKVAEVAEDAAKISGKAQVTRAAGQETMHAATSGRIAAEQAARSDVKSVHLNQTISTATGGEVKSSLRPDVQAVRTDGRVEAHEVLSPGQNANASAAKYSNALGNKAASIKCVPQDKC